MAQTETAIIELFIEKEKQGFYLELPFEVPENVQRIDIRYGYERHRTTKIEGIEKSEEVNIIDLALSSNTGEFIGASGSDRNHIWVSEYDSSDGYAPVETNNGTWNIIVGAYKVQNEGVKVTYEIAFELKERILLKGDCHTHTTGSDGILPVDGIMNLALSNKLDFIFITDHNNYYHNPAIRSSKALTVIPGVEWTHYNGHANMLGVERAFRGKYHANTMDEVQEILNEARQNGAVIIIDHPFDTGCPWKWRLKNADYDCIEIWNGIIKQSDMQCIMWWQNELCSGKHIPIVGGSDFHRFENFSMLGHPTTCVYSMSRGKTDIMNAILHGKAYITFQPEAPSADIHCKDAYMGDTIPFEDGLKISFEFSCLNAGDIIKIYSSAGMEKEISVQYSGNMGIEKEMENKLFYRMEVYRKLLPYLPPMLCLITNPIYISSK
jgi:Predicted metal-dependent phosphoesterases (PHP family)